MDKPPIHPAKFHPEHFHVLSPKTPFVDIILQSIKISPSEFAKIIELAEGYPNDQRLVEMVRMGGDGSAKVPYLMETGETPESILTALREIARPHIERLNSLPEPIKATIELLLSINSVPHGCEVYGIPALLEIDRMQGEMVKTLRTMMVGRKLAADFVQDNVTALQMLDKAWPELRKKKPGSWPFDKELPKTAQMQFEPSIHHNQFVYLHELCVIVDSPHTAELKYFTPSVLKRPLPEHVQAPVTGSADWLIREVGKVGRQFTRALLDIIRAKLDAEKIYGNSQEFGGNQNTRPGSAA